MLKKLFIGLAPLLAVAALTVMPAAAQAAIQHWYKSGAIMPEKEATPFVWWGGPINVNQISPAVPAEVNCKDVGGGMIVNPGGGGAGVGSMNAAAFYECKGPQCEAEALAKFGVEGRESVEAKNMPASINGHPERRFVGWSMLLEEGIVAGVFSVRLKIGEPFGGFVKPSPPGQVRVKDICELAAAEVVIAEGEFQGELKPEIGLAKIGNLNGTSPGKPSQFRFAGASTGALLSEGFGEGTYTGLVRYGGYEEQELITVKP